MTRERFEVRHRPDELRYVLVDHGEDGAADIEIGEESYVDVTTVDGAVQRVLAHTTVSAGHTGQGLAARLVQQVADDIVDHGHTIVAVCPYVAAWLPKHPQYARYTVPPTKKHRSAAQQA